MEPPSSYYGAIWAWVSKITGTIPGIPPLGNQTQEGGQNMAIATATVFMAFLGMIRQPAERLCAPAGAGLHACAIIARAVARVPYLWHICECAFVLLAQGQIRLCHKWFCFLLEPV